MIAVIDYGLGNLRSVAAAVKKVGFEPLITNRPADLKHSDKLILPGVGAFGDGIRYLKQLKLIPILNDLVIAEHKPILGICLGFQMFAKKKFRIRVS